MKFKLDENFGTRTQNLFRQAGYDVHSVWEEGLSGASDQTLYEVCLTEQRCMVTFDLDFSDVIRFPPEKTQGIAVVRLSHNPSLALLEQLISQFLEVLKTQSITGQLWIIEVGRIRIHE